MEARFQRSIDSLDDVFNFIEKFFIKNALDKSLKYSVDLAIEELFTNMIKYNPNNNNKISISLAVDKGRLLISLTDFDVEPFDISKYNAVNTNLPLEKRKIGGLGLHLVKMVMDSIDYHYENRVSKIMLTKFLERTNA